MSYSFPQLRILLVDNYFIRQERVQKLLSSLKCTVDIAENEKEAFAIQSQTPYDLILLERELLGRELSPSLQRLRSACSQPCKIALLAETEENPSDEGAADALIAKPVSEKRLQKLLRTLFPEKAASEKSS